MDVLPFLADVRRRLRGAVALEGSSRLIGTVVALLVALGVADSVWHLPGWLRLALLLGVLAIGGLVAWRRLIQPLRRPLPDRDLALFCERRRPELAGRLITSVEGIALGAAESATLISQLTAAAVKDLVPARKLPSRLIGAGLAMLVVAGLAVASPRSFADGMVRLLLPLSDADWTRRTVLTGSIAHPVVAADDKVQLAIQRSHTSADFRAPVELSWRNDGDGTGDRRQLPGLEGPSWSHGLALPAGRWTITVISGDAHPLTLHAKVVERPQLASITVSVTPPAYTEREATQLATLAASVLAGSRLVIQATFTGSPERIMTAAEVTLPGAAAPLALAADGAGWTAAFTASASGDILIAATDADGIASIPPARFPFAVEPDRPPTATLEGPRRSEAVTAKAKVALRLIGADDLGLADLSLLGAVVSAGGDVAKAPVGKELFHTDEVAKQLRAQRDATVDVGALAAVGERLVLTGRARDRNDISGPGIGLSEPIVLTVVAEDALRQELDRQIEEARDQTAKARNELAEGLGRPERLPGAARSAAQAAARAREVAALVLRRWSENALPADAIAPAKAAEGLLAGTALPALGRAPEEGDPAAKQADAALAEAEKQLGSLLADGDLTRLLAALIIREQGLAEESKGFVRLYLTKAVDAAARALQGNLATRQRDLADQMAELERRILSGPAKALAPAQKLVREQGPAERLKQASVDLAGADKRPQAIKDQQSALTTMQQLLDLLRGSDAAGDLANRAGKLAAEQERLAANLDQGADPRSLQEQQRELAERTEVLAKEVAARDKAAGELTKGANQAQKSAEKAMGKGDRPSASQQAQAAAAMLREAQRKLSGEAKEDEKKDKPKKDTQEGLLALLRTLRTIQSGIVAEVGNIHQRLGDQPIDFGTARTVATIAETQGDVVLRLREDGLKPLEQNAIAKLAVGRVLAALEASEAHLKKPAVGERGVRLATIALAEITRLLAIVRDLPPGEGPKQEGGGEGGGKQPPFPPGAELALLAAMQEEIAAMTAAGRPVDLGAAQAEIRGLVEAAAGAARPGSRGQLLLERARRAMASAAWRLGQADRGLATRNEQAAAEQSLRRLLAEAQGGGGGGGKNDPPPPSNNQDDSGKPPPSGGDSSGGNATAQAPPKSGKTTGSTAVLVTPDDGQFLNLPPALRDRILQARDQGLSPRQLDVFKAYLQNLEDGK